MTKREIQIARKLDWDFTHCIHTGPDLHLEMLLAIRFGIKTRYDHKADLWSHLVREVENKSLSEQLRYIESPQKREVLAMTILLTFNEKISPGV